MVYLIQFLGAIKFQKKELPFIAAIYIDSIMKMNKNNYAQVYLEEYRYEIKKKKMIKFIDAELELDDSDNSDSE